MSCQRCLSARLLNGRRQGLDSLVIAVFHRPRGDWLQIMYSFAAPFTAGHRLFNGLLVLFGTADVDTIAASRTGRDGQRGTRDT